jgi:hypothetical protein
MILFVKFEKNSNVQFRQFCVHQWVCVSFIIDVDECLQNEVDT